jgi:hypothetical protein
VPTAIPLDRAAETTMDTRFEAVTTAPLPAVLHAGPPGRRWLALAGCVGLAVVLVLVVDARNLVAQRAARPMADPGGLWISETVLDDARRLMIVVDPTSRHAAVYHVDAASGTLVLRSTRDITWDLMVDDFNAQEPRPSALKRMLQAGPAPSPPAGSPAR